MCALFIFYFIMWQSLILPRTLNSAQYVTFPHEIFGVFFFNVITGAHITFQLSEECTHILIDDQMPVNEDVVDAIVAKKPIVLQRWVEVCLYFKFIFLAVSLDL